MDVVSLFVLLLLAVCGASAGTLGQYGYDTANRRVPRSQSESPFPSAVNKVVSAYDTVTNITNELFAILAGPDGIDVSTLDEAHGFYDAINDVTIAALKSNQTRGITVDEEQIKRNIYSALLAKDGRLAREMIGKLIALYTFRNASRSRRSTDELKQFCKDLAEKENLASHVNFVHRLITKVREQTVGTLAFAIDTTGSMGEDLETAKYIAKTLIADTEDKPSSYVLAPFSDPEVPEAQFYAATVEGAKDFVLALELLKPTGGGDCPEKAMRGILNALELVEEFSAIFVITDASAKDVSLQEEVIQSANWKGTIVNFFGKQDCGSADDHKVYQDIADQTNGHVVLSISKGESLVDMVKIFTERHGRSSVGGSTRAPTGVGKKRSTDDSKAIRIPVDSSVTEMKIVVTALTRENLSMILDGPYDKDKLNISIGHGYGTAHLSNPPPGYYTLTYSPAASKHTVFLESSLHLQYSFWTQHASSPDLHYLEKPKKGSTAFLLVAIAHGSERLSSTCTQQVQFLDTTPEGNVLSTHNLIELVGKHLLVARVTIPSRPFRLQFVGCDTTGIKVMRQKQFAVIPGDHAIQLELVSSRTISEGVVRATFTISSYGSTSGTCVLQVPSLPAGTSASIVPSSVELSTGTSQQFHITFRRTRSAADSPTFTITASIGSENVANYRYRYAEDARLTRVVCSETAIRPGRNSTGTCTVTNLGPGSGNFSLAVSGGLPEFAVSVSPDTIYLEESESKSVVVNVSAPSSATKGSEIIYKVTTKSSRLDAGATDITFKVSPCDVCYNDGECYEITIYGWTLPVCRCPSGWTGRYCSLAACLYGCKPPYRCVGPDQCG